MMLGGATEKIANDIKHMNNHKWFNKDVLTDPRQTNTRHDKP